MNSLVSRAWHMVPRRVQELIAALIDRLRGYRPPPPPSPDLTKHTRLYVGPVNYAGQGGQWSRALERDAQISATNFVLADKNPYGFPADYAVPWRTFEFSRSWQRTMLASLTQQYTHVLIEACKPVLGGLEGGDVRRQVAMLQDAGLKVGLLAHGTEVRLPSRHLETVPWSHFRDNPDLPTPILQELAEKNLQLIDDLGLPTFVSTAGLLADLPSAMFLGVVVDHAAWSTDSEPLRRSRIRVIHAPTNPVSKGTPLIAPAVHRLHDEGVIEYVEIQGLTREQMLRAVTDADVVLDQFRAGDYGVAACETMAAGRIALTYVTDQVRSEVELQAGMPLPIPQVAPDTIEQVLRDIATRREHFRAVAAQGPEFVRRLHDGRFSRSVLQREFLAV